MATQWHVGDRIQNRWDIYRILKGGMGIVYIVYDHELREPLAAKTFREDVLARDPAIVEGFSREALLWVNLHVHLNVAEARFVMEVQARPFLFLEYVSGGNLGAWVGTPRLTEDLAQILRFAIHFCDGMNHALSKGIKAHRDIKPQNCLITEDRTLKVTDFGLARGAGMQADDGGRGGTPEYMPPEQWDEFKKADERADIYSFGAMLYAMVTGGPPFGRRQEVGLQELERRHKEDFPAPVRSAHRILQPVIDICLAKDPGDRFTDFAIVRGRLAEIYERVTGTPASQPAAGTKLNATRWNNKGVSLIALGRHEEAVTCCDRAIELDSRYELAWCNKGIALDELGRPNEALVCHDHALELNPRLVPIWVNKGMTLMDLERYEEALVCYNRGLEINPRDWRVWANIGAALKALGRNTEALGCYDRAIELNPRDEVAWLNKGVALRALGRIEEAITCCDRALELNPRDQKGWSNMGVGLDELGRHEEAIVCFDHVLELNPRAGEAWSNKGVALRALGRPEEAVICHDCALAINPRHAKVWANKGNALGELGRHEEAIVCCDRAIDLNRDLWEAWSNKGVVLGKLGRHDEAIACFDRALGLNPGSGKVWMGKGDELATWGHIRDGLMCYEEAQRLGVPQAGEVLAALRQIFGKLDRQESMAQPMTREELETLWDATGVAAGKSGRHKESIIFFERALALNLRHATAWHNKGVALSHLGRFEEAIGCYDRAIEVKPGYASAWFSKGSALGNSGYHREALPCFEEAKRLGHSQAAQMIALCRQMLDR